MDSKRISYFKKNRSKTLSGHYSIIKDCEEEIVKIDRNKIKTKWPEFEKENSENRLGYPDLRSSRYFFNSPDVTMLK